MSGTFLAMATTFLLAACTNPGDIVPTATAIRSESTELQRSKGVFAVADDRVLWVTESDDILVEADDIERQHPDILAGRGITLLHSGSDAVAVVSDDESVMALPVRASDGSGGVALIRSDGYNMALHIYGDSTASLGSIKFMPEFGLTLLSLADGAGSSVIAINNYGLKQFDLPVTDALGTLRYSPDELRYMVIDRRPVQEELELIPFAEPGESTLFRPSNSSEEADELYRSLTAVITTWQ